MKPGKPLRSPTFRTLAACALFAAAILLPVADAHASTTWGCQVKYVMPSEWITPGGVHTMNLGMQCADSSSYEAWQSNTPGCTTYTSLDLVKAYTSIAQSALLSGKAVDIAYTYTCGRNMITGLALSGW